MLGLYAIIPLSAFDGIMPEGRRAAIIATFEQIAGLRNAANAAPTALLEAFHRLSVPQEGDAPPVVARRATLAEIVKGAGHVPSAEIDVQKAAWWFAAQLNEWKWKDEGDPRQKAMCSTAYREAKALGLRFCSGCMPEAYTPEYTEVTCASGCGISYADFSVLS
tara:strand:- start:2594 stop:3085 length:492 start_codon:yes stop_codon:yes gene_type:complete